MVLVRTCPVHNQQGWSPAMMDWSLPGNAKAGAHLVGSPFVVRKAVSGVGNVTGKQTEWPDIWIQLYMMDL